MQKINSFISLLLVLLGFQALAQTASIEIRNEQAIGSEYYFDIYFHTDDIPVTTIALGNTDLRLFYTTSSFTSPTFSKVAHPAPVSAIQKGYCTFTSLTNSVSTDIGAIVNVQLGVYNNTATSIDGDNLVINLLGTAPSSTADHNSRVPLITGCTNFDLTPDKNRLGRFVITGLNSPTDPVNLQCKLTGGGLLTKVSEIEDTAPFTETQITADCRACILPVELTSFTAENRNNQQVDLEWSTATEIDNSHFDIQRSTDGATWATIGNQTSAGNTQEAQYYSYQDRQPHNGINYYRLKIIDLDNSFEYSDIQAVKITRRATVELSIYPNPTKGIIQIEMPEDKLGTLQLALFDVSGGQVMDIGPITPQQRRKAISIAHLPAGVYLLKETSSTDTQVQKIIKH